MLKKILAASTASVLALTALATTAMADDATASAKDDYTLELVPGKYTTSWTDPTTAHITASLKNTALAGLIAPTKAVPVTQVPSLRTWTTLPADIKAADVKATGLADNEYGYVDNAGALYTVAAGLPDATNINVTAGITNGMQLVKVADIKAATGASLAGATVSLVKEFVGLGSIDDKANPYNKLAMGLNLHTFTPTGGTAQDVLKWSDFAMTNISMSVNIVGEGTDSTTAGGVTTIKNNVARTATGSCTFEDIKGRTDADVTHLPTGINELKGSNWVTSPKVMTSTFGLNTGKTLDVIKSDESTFTIDFDIEMSNDHWKTILNAAGVVWNTTSNEWDVLSFEKLLNEKGDVLLATFLGIEGSSVVDWAVGATGAAATEYLQVGHLAMTSVSSTKATDVKPGEKHTTDNQNWFDSGVEQAAKGGAFNNTPMSLTIGLGVASNKVLENLNNGGTVTFEFDKDIRPQDVFNPYIICWGNSGTPINLPLTLENTYEAGSNSITLKLPSGLTWATGNTNFYNSFRMQYNFNYVNILNNTNVSMPALGVTSSETTDLAEKNNFFVDAVAGDKDATGADNYGAKLVKITFKANKEAGNGGLVDPGNSGNNSTSTPTNSGSNGGDEKNPGTGVAVAVAPVILAAAGAAVVISKKRK